VRYLTCQMPPTVLLDPTPDRIIQLIRSGRNIFITGPGGTGKSTIVNRLNNEITNINVTAMTGCAALLLECKAKTLHSWAGIGLGRDSTEKCIEHITKRSYLKKQWTSTRTLVIDEVSMLTPELFEKLDVIGRAVRKRSMVPFGGLQIIAVGDFCQLPPIPRDASGQEIEMKFLFESDIWDSSIQYVVLLTKIWRQKDPVYQKLLSEIRLGIVSEESEAVLRSRMNTNWRDESIRPTLLFSRNSEVDRVNSVNLVALEEEPVSFACRTTFEPHRWALEHGNFSEAPDKDSDSVRFAINKLDTDAPYLQELVLKRGAQVMVLRNLDIKTGLVNGSRGIIVDFEPIRRFPIIKIMNGTTHTIEPYTWWSNDMPHVGRTQIPLRIAYASTIHKSQGASIDSALVDIGKTIFECGQAYVALSRVRSLEGLHVHALDIRRIKTHPRVLEYYRMIDSIAKSELAAAPCEGAASGGGFVLTPAAESEAWALNNVHKSWLPLLNDVLGTPEGIALEKFVSESRKSGTIYPKKEDVFAALRMDMSKVTVVILGQDPYHGPEQAMGLAFSVPDNVAAPPSLKNIMKEISSDLGTTCVNANLSSWTEQGVLLLNTLLTVEASKPLSHAQKGWETVTDRILKELSSKCSGIVFLLWGKTAQKKSALINTSQKHTILEAAHPSPLSAYNGFFGCKHFSKTNSILGAEKAIRWIE